MKFRRIILSIALLSAVSAMNSCVDLDILPPSMITSGDAYKSQDHIEAHLARIYSQIPMEDFRYTPQLLFQDWYDMFDIANNCGETLGRDGGGARAEDGGYWDAAYRLIRNINEFIDGVNATGSQFSDANKNQWLGEAYFARAFTYFALAKRFGGVPLIDQVIVYPGTPLEQTQLFRNSEADTWKFIKDDFDRATSMLPATPIKTNGIATPQRANKYVAYALKSRAMLFAASIAKYNTAEQALFDENNNNTQLCGFPESERTAKAKEYYKLAYDAAKEVENSGQYELYTSDGIGTVKNYTNIFWNKSSRETILSRDYAVGVAQHGYDAYNIPRQYANGSRSSNMNPTLEFVELFDGLPKNADGTFKVFDDAGNYILYGTQGDFDNSNEGRYAPFANAEPRLLAIIGVPGSIMKNDVLDIRCGIYKKGQPLPTKTTGIIADEGRNGTLYNETYVVTMTNENDNNSQIYTMANGEKMRVTGTSGVWRNHDECCYSGFGMRKYINESMAKADVKERNSFQSWIEIRYAEVLLNKAEAALELIALGESSATYLPEAYNVIKDIRERAGAVALASQADVNMDVYRKERQKELAFEHHRYWDLRRWRMSQAEMSNDKVYRTLMPFIIDGDYRYFFDVRYDKRNQKYNWDNRWYYFNIPSGERSKNPNCKNNAGY